MTDVHYDPAHHAKLRALEDEHFWFRSRNRLLVWAIGRSFPDARSLFEIGCGTGYVLAGIRAAFPDMALFGGEPFEGAIAFARERVPDARIERMEATSLTFDADVDVVCAFDVLEHIDDDRAALREMHRVARLGIAVTVPQHPWLWSRADAIAGHRRRYRRSGLVAAIEDAGFRVELVTSFVSLLLPAMALSRASTKPDAELDLPGPLDAVLERVMNAELALIRAGARPRIGGSLLVTARTSR